MPLAPEEDFLGYLVWDFLSWAKREIEFILPYSQDGHSYVYALCVLSAIVWTQLMLVRFGCWVENQPYPMNIVDPILIFRIIFLLGVCFVRCFFGKCIEDEPGEARYIKLEVDHDKEGRVIYTVKSTTEDMVIEDQGMLDPPKPIADKRVLVILACGPRPSDNRVGGLLVLSDQKRAEFFTGRFPRCCKPHAISYPDAPLPSAPPLSSVGDHPESEEESVSSCSCDTVHFPGGDGIYRLVMAAWDLWNENWPEAEEVDFIVPDGEFVNAVERFFPSRHSDNESRNEECYYIEKMAKCLGDPLVFHHSQNITCITKEVEVWRNLVEFTKVLTRHQDGTSDAVVKAWKETHLATWPRSKRKICLKNFHALPHPLAERGEQMSTKRVQFHLDWSRAPQASEDENQTDDRLL